MAVMTNCLQAVPIAAPLRTIGSSAEIENMQEMIHKVRGLNPLD
jgi:hypothetical protein